MCEDRAKIHWIRGVIRAKIVSRSQSVNKPSNCDSNTYSSDFHPACSLGFVAVSLLDRTVETHMCMINLFV